AVLSVVGRWNGPGSGVVRASRNACAARVCARRSRVLRKTRPADSGYAVPGMSQRQAGRAEGWPAPRYARGESGRRGDGAGGRARQAEGKPARRRGELRRPVPDAAEVEAARRGSGGADPLGRDGGAVARGEGGEADGGPGRIRSGRAEGEPLVLAADR